MLETPPAGTGQIITFYSYKGGTGRSMALANVACLLAQQLTSPSAPGVLMIDWDLEAPGLPSYFRPYLPDTLKTGVIELFQHLDSLTAAVEPGLIEPPPDIAAQLASIRLDQFIVKTSIPGLSLMPAGADAPDYSKRVSDFDWSAFYDRVPWIIPWFAHRLSSSYSYTLIDSRTGETDTSGICTALLPEKLVTAFTLNQQSVTGVLKQIRRSLQHRHKSFDERPIIIYPLPTRIEHAREQLREKWRFDKEIGFQPRFEALFRELFDDDIVLDTYFDDVSIPQNADYAYGERIAVREERSRDVFSLAGRYSLLTVRLTSSEPIWESLPTIQGSIAEQQLRRHAPAPAPSSSAASVWADAPSFVTELEAAARSFDAERMAQTCSTLIARLWTTAEPFPEDSALRALDLLRRQQQFDLVLKLGGAFWESGQSGFRVRLKYAQALIDRNEYTAAISILTDIALATSREFPSQHENAEARAMLGRTYKLMYMAAGCRTPQASHALETAIRFYREGYMEAPDQRIHMGLNYVALALRAKRDQVPAVATSPDPLEVARSVLRRIESMPDSEVEFWHSAAAAEMCIALERWDDAYTWMNRYISHPGVDGHSLLATRRQLADVWQLTELTSPGNSLLSMVNSRLLQQHRGAQVAVARGDLEQTSFGTSQDLQTVRWYQTGLKRSQAVARIETIHGKPLASGFLIRGKDLLPLPLWGNELVLLTVSHVVDGENPSRFPQALHPEQVMATFSAGERKVEIKEVLWSSPPSDLGVSILLPAEDLSDIDPCLLASSRPPLEESTRVFLMGHPGGQELQMAISDNVLLDYQDQLLHYRAPTQQGSSGSPVFDESWRVIGVHVRGGELARLNGKPGTYNAGEGIWIGAIRSAIFRSFGTSVAVKG